MYKSRKGGGNRYGITPPFSGKDFSSWWFRVEAILDEQGVLYCVQTEESSISDSLLKLKFVKDDGEAKQ